ncbi:MAG: hypothetical protein GY698_14585 [Actinomycetia bacterium]|nr:hypothetical protein [Actinomycetes bacterium]
MANLRALTLERGDVVESIPISTTDRCPTIAVAGRPASAVWSTPDRLEPAS